MQLLLDLINRRDADFIALAITPWHAMGVDVALNRLFPNGNASGVIVIQAHRSNKMLLDTTDFACSTNPDIEFVVTNPYDEAVTERRSRLMYCKILMNIGKAFFRFAKKDARPVYIISPLNIRLDILSVFGDKRCLSTRKPSFAIVDEGIGAYFSDASRELEKLGKDRKSRCRIFFKRNVLRIRTMLIRWLTRRVRNSFGVQSFRAFSQSDGTIEANQDIVTAYKQVIACLTKRTTTHLPENTVLFLSQPFVEDGFVDVDAFKNLLVDMHGRCRAQNTRFLIKLHPRDDEQLYRAHFPDIELVDKKIPVELLYADPHIRLVVGVTSTSLIIANVFYAMAAVSITHLFDTQSTHGYIHQSFEDFERIGGRYVTFIHDMASFESMLKSIADK